MSAGRQICFVVTAEEFDRIAARASEFLAPVEVFVKATALGNELERPAPRSRKPAPLSSGERHAHFRNVE